MKGRIKQDDSSVPSAGRRLRLFRALSRWRPASADLPAAPPRRPGRGPARRRRAWPAARPSFHLGGTRHSPDHQLLAWSSDSRGAEFYTVRVRDLRHGADLADAVRRRSGSAGRVDRRCERLLLRAARPQPSPVPRVPASSWARRPRTTCWCSRSRIPASSSPFRACSPAASPRSRCTITRLRSAGCSISPSPMPRLRLVARARDRRSVRGRASSGSVRRARPGDPHQCRRRRGLQDRLDAACEPARAQWRELSRIAPASTCCRPSRCCATG